MIFIFSNKKQQWTCYTFIVTPIRKCYEEALVAKLYFMNCDGQNTAKNIFIFDLVEQAILKKNILLKNNHHILVKNVFFTKMSLIVSSRDES